MSTRQRSPVEASIARRRERCQAGSSIFRRRGRVLNDAAGSFFFRKRRVLSPGALFRIRNFASVPWPRLLAPFPLGTGPNKTNARSILSMTAVSGPGISEEGFVSLRVRGVLKWKCLGHVDRLPGTLLASAMGSRITVVW